MDTVILHLGTLPVLSVLAAGFYLILAISVLNGGARAWVRARLVMPTPSNQAYVAAVDTIRGAAALYVAIFHSWQWTRPTFDPTKDALPFLANGDLAVPIFVVVSAFLITRALFGVSDLEDLKAYFFRRLLRIYPLYLVVIVAMILTGLFPVSVPNFFSRLLGEVFMLRMLGFQSFVNPVAWSLYVEAAFYITAPMLMILLGRWLLPAAAVAVVVLYATEIFAVVQFAREYALWRFFLFGMLAALVIVRLEHIESDLVDYVLLVAGAVVVALEVGPRIDVVHVLVSVLTDELVGGAAPPTRHQSSFGLGVGLAAVIVGLARSRRLSEWLSPVPMRMLGCVSYSLFLWHPVLICIDAPIRFNGSGSVVLVGQLPPGISQWSLLLIFAPGFIMAAVLSFVAIERPFLLMRRRLKGAVPAAHF